MAQRPDCPWCPVPTEATTRIPHAVDWVCLSHAESFWHEVVRFAGATARVYREAPGHVADGALFPAPIIVPAALLEVTGGSRADIAVCRRCGEQFVVMGTRGNVCRDCYGWRRDSVALGARAWPLTGSTNRR